ncbi:MAG: SurA N-terminal domain-containing protein [Deltaproteobacteria bacterium]|nr:SurA N-terminal domain-containing protein [Deltaproteobacteria bacterium]
MANKKQEIEIAVAEVVDYLRITGQFSPALKSVVERKVTALAARKSGIKVSTKQLQSAADTFRAMNGLIKASDTEKWLKQNGLTVDALEEYLETNILINGFKNKLEKKAGAAKYMKAPIIKESVKELIYKDWLENEMK